MDIPSGASHDSAAFADAGVPTAMLFIRNATVAIIVIDGCNAARKKNL